MDEWEDELEKPDSSHLSLEEKTWIEAEFGPEITERETFVMLGPWSHGSSVALLRESGQVWLAELKEPRSRADGRRWIPPRPRVQEGQDELQEQRDDDRPGFGKKTVAEWAERNFQWLRWVVALSITVAGGIWVPVTVRWGLESGWVGFAWVSTVALAVGLLPWPFLVVGSLPSPAIAHGRHGLTRYGSLRDEVIARDRLVAVVAGETAVALRLKEPDEAAMVLPEEIGLGLQAAGAAREMHSWFSSAPSTSRSGRRPSAGLVGMVMMVAVWVVAIVPLLG